MKKVIIFILLLSFCTIPAQSMSQLESTIQLLGQLKTKLILLLSSVHTLMLEKKNDNHEAIETLLQEIENSTEITQEFEQKNYKKTEIIIPTTFTSDWIKKIKNEPENVIYEYQKLTACGCDNFNLTSRLVLCQKQIEALKQQTAPQSINQLNPLVITSLGSGHLLQLFLLVDGLIKTGYKYITLNAIDPLSTSTDKQNFMTALNKQTTISIITFSSTLDYIKGVETGTAKRSHSFDLIDIGGAGYSEFKQDEALNRPELIIQNEDTIKRHNVFLFKGISGTFLIAQYLPSGDLWFEIVEKNIHHSRNKSESLHFLNRLKWYLINRKNDFKNNPQKLFHVILTLKNKLIETVNPTEKPGWCTDLQWFNIACYMNPWSQFAELIKKTTLTNVIPVIFEGEHNRIFQYQNGYNGYQDKITYYGDEF